MTIRFGRFELDEEQYALRRDGETVRVQPRVLDTIMFFAHRPHVLVTKDQLIAGPWRGNVVSDAAVSQTIKRVRAALGDSGGSQMLETVRGRGFRFCAGVTNSS